MALGACIAGRYSGTYQAPAGSALDMGITEQGWEIGIQHAKERIDETDAWGGALADNVFRGIRNVSIQLNALEWKAGILRAIAPYGAALPASGNGYLGPGVIGRLDSDVAGSVVLSAVSGTPAAAAPASLTASLAIVSEDSVRFALNSKLRRIALRFDILPYVDAGTVKYFSVL